MRRALRFLISALLIATPCAAQQRVRVVVDYVTAGSIYISAGQAQGLFAGDTVLARRDTMSQHGARFVIGSSTRARAVALRADTAFTVQRGDTLFLALSARAAQRLAESAKHVPQTAALPPPVAGPAPDRKPVSRHAAVSGRVGIELDAMRASTRYGAGEDQTTSHTYTNPTLRLRMNVSDLPGGVRVITNLRANYYGGASTRAGEVAVQVYQASAEADFGRGTHVQLGRFYNPYESHSGYWDGLLIRVGSTHMGGGVVAGYAPEYGNQTISSLAPKFSAFVDAHARRTDFRYDVDLSVHQQQNTFFGGQREFIGLSQSLGYKRAYFTQRLQAGRSEAGDLSVWQAQLTGNVQIGGPLRVHARYSTERNEMFFGVGESSGQRVRWSGGASLAGRIGFANIERGVVESGLGMRAATSSATFYLPRALAIVGFGFNGSLTEGNDFRTTYLAPYLERSGARIRARAGFNYYQTDYGTARFEQRGGDVMLAVPLGRRSEIAINGSAAAGSNLTTTRAAISFWRSF